ncbi:HPP family protein [Paenibacillus sp. JCM 10914]|uniref:HPP family protein n=1 Tax=Paenibacillus sp. JCM 10914 TaxID=1236974 RepID=UPI0022B1F4AB|nr:HPP family protein [Paenibacillus sp. JCM 10914]
MVREPAISLMGLTRMTHPPAGADLHVVIKAGSGWSLPVTPITIDSVITVKAA